MNRKLLTILGLVAVICLAGTAYARPANAPRSKKLPLSELPAAKAALDTVFFDDFESDTIVWDTVDVFTQANKFWHIDSYQAYAGSSWWCGTADSASEWISPTGYGNAWIQYLYSPDFDLTSVTSDSVILSYMQLFNVEGPSLDPSNNMVDWDCVNLWGSTDGGSNWFVLYPDTNRGSLRYNLTDATGWVYCGLAPIDNNIPGWGGPSGGWRKDYFDLTAYKGQVLKLRFTVVSDGAYSDAEANVTGGEGAWHIDDIAVDTITGGVSGHLFFDDVEGGNLGWTMGVKKPRINWHETGYRTNTPVTAWYSGDTTTHLQSWGYTDALVSPPIDLSKVKTTDPCYASFTAWADMFELDGGYTRDHDYFTVEVTTDGGSTWLLKNFYDPLATQKTWVPIADIAGGTINLTNYIGKTVQVRICMNTDEDYIVGEGLYLDDFIVTGKTQDANPPATTILVVDDDGGAVDMAGESWTKYLEASLANLGYQYAVTTIGSNKPMLPGYLEQFPVVIWNLGANYDYRAGSDYYALPASDKLNLMSYLNNGGKLWMSGQNYFFNNGTLLDTTVHPNLWRDYLHLSPDNGWANIWCDSIVGVTADMMGDGFSDSLLYSRLNGGGLPWTGPDRGYSLRPDTPAVAVEGFMLSNDGSFNGIRYEDATAGYKYVYTSFPFEAISLPEKRDTMAARIINWLLPVSPDYNPPAVPTGLAAAQYVDTVKCTWNGNTEPDIKSYNVYRSVLSGLPVWEKIGTVLHPDTTFADAGVSSGMTYNYAVSACDTNPAPLNESLKSTWVSLYINSWKLGVEGEGTAASPVKFNLAQNIPNPFRGSTVIKFALPEPCRVKLVVYNVAGQQISDLSSGQMNAGYHSISWNGRDNNGVPAANGVYFYRLEAQPASGKNAFVQTKRLIMVK